MRTETPTPTVEFVQRFSATRKAAVQSRLLALHTLDAWGLPRTCPTSESAAQIIAELAANAVTHARLPGRDFELRLTLTPETLRIEVSDALTESTPPPTPADPSPDAESGRGLFLVDALSSAWGTRPREIGKTVWADLPLLPQ
ncbi:ATP-binding protein [Streptomyces jumonjinensis]|uniref:ATP-binding protein n=1 Tax=Streptomyces jumonjinensis TaxID=1945 RepID=UPI0037AA7A9C